jgi:integrase
VLPEVLRRLVEHGLPVLRVARVARDPEVAHAPATLAGLAGWRADAGNPTDSLRPSWHHRVNEWALFRPMLEQRYWTDSGEAFDDRGLKHRAENDTRSLPIPSELVVILREHIEEFGTAADGRLFRTATGGMIFDTTHTRAVARTLALTPEQVVSPLAARPYDLRHAAVSLWLNGGVAATEVANRAGHSVEVLLRVYAKCIDGGEEVANRRIDEALAP